MGRSVSVDKAERRDGGELVATVGVFYTTYLHARKTPHFVGVAMLKWQIAQSAIISTDARDARACYANSRRNA